MSGCRGTVRVTVAGVVVSVLIAGVLAGFASHHEKPRTTLTMSDVCLGCICEATTNCTVDIGCSRGRCGPFFIAERYWTEAGRPVLHGDNPRRVGAYQDCVVDPYCASRTVLGYMNRYVQDCNHDGHIDCEDFARIHYMGGHQCHLPVHHYNYFRVFRTCMHSVQHLNG